MDNTLNFLHFGAIFLGFSADWVDIESNCTVGVCFEDGLESLRGWLFITCEVGLTILLGFIFKIFVEFGGHFQIGELLSEGHFNKVYQFQSIIVYELKLNVFRCK